MRKTSKRKYNLTAFLAKHGINQRILGELIVISRATVSKWDNDGEVPIDYLSKIRALTKTEIDAKAKWIAFDLTKFRQKWGLTITQLARELRTSVANIRNWEAAKEIPRTRLPDVRRARERCRCRMYRRNKK